MTKESQSKMMCHLCAGVVCRSNYPKGVPAYCMAAKHHDVLEQTKTEYATPDVSDIFRAAAAVTARGVEQNGTPKWPRIQEAIEFAKELKLTQIGLASCTVLIRELGLVAELFTGAGFKVTSVVCQVGRVSPGDRGFPELEGLRGVYCNPIAQAEILNNAGTELNYILGLCMGHDILFSRYSKAPVSTLIVKDKVTGHNPAVALYSWFHRRSLWKTYCNKDVLY